MVFNSLTFALFFALVLALHNLPLSWAAKKRNLLVASYLFYAAWNPPLVLLLWGSTVVDWLVARAMYRAPDQRRRKRWLLVSLGLNLGLLAVFKYGAFFLQNFQALLALGGVQYAAPAWNIMLPVGISFYTFHSLSYTLDIYGRRATPVARLSDYMLFVSFFTQLVAGPILRKAELVPQLASPRTANLDQMVRGLALMTLGLFQKVVLADGAMAPAADAVFGSTDPVGALDAWIGALAFTGQIFCDFAGYSTIAVGAALCLGFIIPANFAAPYAAIGLSDFWRRWHISLSRWLRDYLYIPLGGNRRGEARTCVNLMLTMLLGGLWHGANWTFVAWGGLHGAGLVAERWLVRRAHGVHPGRWVTVVLAGLTFLFIVVTWVVFRAKTLGGALALLAGMAGLHPDAAPLLASVKIAETVACVAALVGVHWLMRRRDLAGRLWQAWPPGVAAGWAAMAFCVAITQGSGDAFIYFQF